MGSQPVSPGALRAPESTLDQRILELPDRLLDLMPAAVYVCDRSGTILRYNKRAAELWGRTPEIGESADLFGGALSVYRLDGGPQLRLEGIMADVIRIGAPARDQEVVIERPNGSRVIACATLEPIANASGAVVGAISTLVDISERKRTEQALKESEGRYRTLFNSIDAGFCTVRVVFDETGRPVDYVILDVNPSFVRLTGLEDAAGKSMRALRPDHEDDWFETYGRIALTGKTERFERRASALGRWYSVHAFRVGAAEDRTVAILFADISERIRAEEQQAVLLREMNHRVKNLFALASGVASLSARSARSTDDMVTALHGRLAALARAHELTLPDLTRDTPSAHRATTLDALLSTIVSPWVDTEGETNGRIVIEGPALPISGPAVTSLALLLHEFATNSAKHGSLSRPTGQVAVQWSANGPELEFNWREEGGPTLSGAPDGEGFGSLLARGTVKAQFGGKIEREWRPEGLTIRLSVPIERLAG